MSSVSSSLVSGSSSPSPKSTKKSVDSKSPSPLTAEAFPPNPSLDDPKFRRFVEERDLSEFRRRQTLKSKLPKTSGPSATTDEDLKKLGFSREEIEAQKEKRNAWMKSEDEENDRIRRIEEEKASKSSARALKIVLALWAILIVGIFYFVLSTLMQSAEFNRNSAKIQMKGEFTPRDSGNHPFGHGEL